MPAEPLTSIPAPSGRIDGSGPPDRHEDGGGRELLLGAGDRFPSGGPGVVGATGRAGRHAAKADQGPVATDDLDRREAGEDDDPLTFGGFDLLDLRRHLCSVRR